MRRRARLNAYDQHNERITPIAEGQTIDFSAYGFSLTVPDDFALNDYTTNNAAEGGNALFAGCAYGELGELYIFCYTNESGDALSNHKAQDVVTYYMNAGATDVRMRTLGGRRLHLLPRNGSNRRRRRNMGYLRNMERRYSDFV